jgi:hypothetical protein
MATIVPPTPPELAASPVEKPPRDAFAQLVKPLPKASEKHMVPVKRRIARHFQVTRMAAYRPAPKPEAFSFGW